MLEHGENGGGRNAEGDGETVVYTPERVNARLGLVSLDGTGQAV